MVGKLILLFITTFYFQDSQLFEISTHGDQYYYYLSIVQIIGIKINDIVISFNFSVIFFRRRQQNQKLDMVENEEKHNDKHLQQVQQHEVAKESERKNQRIKLIVMHWMHLRMFLFMLNF